jgi:hypothetical protein
MRRGLHVWKHAGALPAGALLAALLTSGCAPEKPPAAPPAAGTNAAARTGTAGVTRGFKVPDYDAENKLKSMLSGEEARPLPEERFQILGLHVETYDAAGKPELIVEAPECVFDRKQRVARPGSFNFPTKWKRRSARRCCASREPGGAPDSRTSSSTRTGSICERRPRWRFTRATCAPVIRRISILPPSQ